MPRSIKPRGPTIATGHLDCQQCTIAMANIAVAVTNAAVIGTSALTTTTQMWACTPQAPVVARHSGCGSNDV